MDLHISFIPHVQAQKSHNSLKTVELSLIEGKNIFLTLCDYEFKFKYDLSTLSRQPIRL